MENIEPWVKATVEKIPPEDLRPLLCNMLTRLRQVDGLDYLMSAFPILADHYVAPVHYNWNP
jgi:hypothetical protein